MLIDSGADRVYVDRKVAQRAGKIERGRTMVVKLPNGASMATDQYAFVLLQVGSYRFKVEAVVLDLSGYDVVLGLAWLKEANPSIDWTSSTVRITDKRGKHILEPYRDKNQVEGTGGDHGLISHRTLRKMLKDRLTETFLYVIRTDDLLGDQNGDQEKPPDLPENVPRRFMKVIRRFKDRFRTELPDKLPPHRGFDHVIDTGDAKPVNLNPYPLSPSQLQEQTSQVRDLLSKGLIRVSSSPWGFPVLFAKKGDGKWRMCIDYRALNAVTERNTYPLPRIQECLDQIGHAKRISKLDLTLGFHQLRLDESSIPKTAFNTRQGKFEYLVMPFGLTNAPATFQTLMNTVLQEYLDRFVVVYLDDLVIYSQSKEEHEKHLELVLTKLRENDLFAKPSKCIIGAETVEFCGHKVGQGKLKTCRSKTQLIEEWPVPTNVHEVRQFLGLASYYCRFVRNFATHSAPLSDLLKEDDPELRKKKNRPIIWNARCQLAFLKLKQALTSEPVLAQADFTKPFVIETDASEGAIGCCLLQVGEDNKMHLVAYDGRKLQGPKLRYPVQEKELLAIKHAVRTWSYYIDNHTRTKILTDHQSLRYLKDTKVPSKRLAHWIAEFGTYDLDIQYRPGTEATVPDAISRRPDFMGKGQAHEHPSAQSNGLAIRSVDEADWEQAMIEYLRDGRLPDDDKLRKAVLEDTDHPPTTFKLIKDTMLYKVVDNGMAPYIAPGIRSAWLEHLHKKYGHLGWPGLNGVIKTRGWWPTLERDVWRQVKNCPECQVTKGAQLGQNRGARQILEKEEGELFDRWSLDLIGILPRSMRGNRWIITAIERSTGWPIARAVKDATSLTVMEFIHREIFTEYRIPNEILTDNGANLVSEAVETFLKPTKLKHRTTTPYHPQTNGKVERLNGTIGKLLAKYLYGKPIQMWDDYLDQAVFSVRIRHHAVSGYSPFKLLFGTDPKLPEDDRDPAPASAEARIESMIKRHELANEARLTANRLLVENALKARLVREDKVPQAAEIPVGTYVVVRDESARKLKPTWFGPYKVVLAAPIGTYALEDKDGRITRNLVHGNRLRPVSKHIIDPDTGMWRASMDRRKLDQMFEIIDHSAEMVAEILDENTPGFSYKELATVSKKERIDLISKGLEKSKLGEGKVGNVSVAQHIFEKLKARVDANERREEKEARKEETAQGEEVVIPLPERISHTLEPLVVQEPVPEATSRLTPPAQVDVPTVDLPLRERTSPPELEAGREDIPPDDIVHPVAPEQPVQEPVHVEAGGQNQNEAVVAQSTAEVPPQEAPKPRRRPRTSVPITLDEHRDTKSSYALRQKPPRAIPKEQRGVVTKK